MQEVVLDQREQIALALELHVEIIRVIAAVLHNRDFRDGAVEEIAGSVFDRHLHGGDAAAVMAHARHTRG